MCGRIQQEHSVEAIMARMLVNKSYVESLTPRYNLAPQDQAAVVYPDESGNRCLRMMTWGLIPPWNPAQKTMNLFNIQVEKFLTKPVYHKLRQQGRCLIPSSGFYEWREVNGEKIPYRFILKEDLFGYGGVYRLTQNEKGEDVYTFSLMTTEPNEDLRRVHDRSPVIIPKDYEAAWLNPSAQQSDYVAATAPYPAQDMFYYRVDKAVNTTVKRKPVLQKIDYPELLNPVPDDPAWTHPDAAQWAKRMRPLRREAA